jgi:tetratricopeptide (TPR) repeat protein
VRLLLAAAVFLVPLFAQQKRALIQPNVEKNDKLTGKTYALIVGISQYKQDPPVTSLQFADKDAESFAELLQKPIAGELAPKDQIRLLTNKQATRAAIDDAVREFGRIKDADQSTLILFVAAHGVYLKSEVDPDTQKVIERDPYILTYDSNPQDAKVTGYPMDDFRRMVAVQAVRFGRVLVFLDVCHAGNVAGIGGGSELDGVVRKVWEGGAGDLGLMLASHSKKFAVESPSFGGGHGAFSYFVISGLNGAAASTGETSISFADLAVYVIKNVKDFTRSQQIPDKSSTNDDMIVVADTKKPGITLPPAKPLSDAEVRQLRQRGTDQAAPPLPPLQDPNSRDRIELEDKGQEVMSRYLEGEEVPLKQVDFEHCADWFEAAYQLDNTNTYDRSRALFCRGRAAIFSKQYTDAENLLNQSIQLDSRRAYAYNALGIAHLERARYDEAATVFRTAMRYAPYWAYPIHNLALTNSERGDFDGAIRLYQFAMTVAPRYSYLPYSLGLLYTRLGDFENARKSFEKAREVLAEYSKPRNGVWPERARVWNALGTVERSAGRDNRAFDYFQKAQADDPNDPNALHNLALIYAKRGDYTKADELWKSNKDFPMSQLAYADSLASRGQRDQAIIQYEQLVSEKKEYVAAHESLARLYLAKGEAVKALVQANTALSLAASNPSVLELRGDIQSAQGDRTAATADWRTALASATTKDARARLEKKLTR